MHQAQCIRRHSPDIIHPIEGRGQWEVLHTPSIPHLKVWIKLMIYKTNKPTSQLPRYHPGIPRWQLYKILWRMQWIRSLVLGLEGKASLSLTSKDGKVTLAFSPTLRQLSTPLNPLSLLALKLRLPDLPLLNLQLISIHLLDLMNCSGGGVNTDLEKTNSINSMEFLKKI